MSSDIPGSGALNLKLVHARGGNPGLPIPPTVAGGSPLDRSYEPSEG